MIWPYHLSPVLEFEGYHSSDTSNPQSCFSSMISVESILILSCHALPFSSFEVNILYEASKLM